MVTEVANSIDPPKVNKKMVLIAEGKFKQSSRSRTGLIFVSSNLSLDSNFPLRNPCRVIITITPDRKLIVEEAKA